MVRFGEAALLALAVAAGVAIAMFDSRPGWDDTAVTAGLLVMAAAITAATSGRRPWLFGLAVGAWTPLLEVIGSGRMESVAALAFAALGAAIGFGVSRSGRSRG